MASGEPTNEIGWAFMEATTTPQNFPQPVFSVGPAAGTRCLPSHALISIEGGDIRYRLDGSDPVDIIGGVLGANGTMIDWTNPLVNYQAFINNCRIIAANGATQVQLNISWRN